MMRNRAEYQRQRREADPERFREYTRKSYVKLREKRCAEQKARRDADVEKYRAYQREQYAKHAEKRRESARKKNEKNREQLAAKAREKYRANREEMNARAKELRKRPETRAKAAEATRRWQAEHPERMEIHHAKRVLAGQVGCRPRDIPEELAAAKFEQLKITRWVREQLAIAGGTQSAETNEDSAQSEGCQSGAASASPDPRRIA